ncbi:MAG: DUF4199 domain-containing protein [Bacteroidetes bacterium]|nr:DUF4199 domain-containing protein [Bacteroidota bacterium]
MFKKIVLYGLAYGSAATAMHLIYWYRDLYLTPSFGSVLPLLGNVVFTGLAVWQFLKQLKKESAEPVNLGKALFGSLLTSLLVAMCTIAGLQHVLKNEPGKIKSCTDIAMKHQTARIQKETKKEEQAAKIEEAKAYVSKQLDPMSISVSQIQMCLSTGVVIALLVFVRSGRNS